MKKMVALTVILAAFSLINFLVLAVDTSSVKPSITKEKLQNTKAKREEFLQKKETIQDAKKKAIVERIDLKIANINKKRTDQMTEHLKKMLTILGKLQDRGIDTAAAQTVITAAQTAVNSQAAKEYVLTISTENKLKADVGGTVKQLEQDLKTVNKLVIAAKQSIADAIKNAK